VLVLQKFLIVSHSCEKIQLEKICKIKNMKPIIVISIYFISVVFLMITSNAGMYCKSF